MSLKYSSFEWDRGNQDKNLLKHGVTCEEAEEVFKRRSFVYPDTIHSTEKEKRYVIFGETIEQRPLFVAFTLRDDKIRIISARPMSQKERSWYDEEKRKGHF